MSDSVRPHRRQPTRLPCPWDSPGKNTGVACHFLLQCIKVKSESEVAQLCPTLSDLMDCSLPGSSIHRISQARVLGHCKSSAKGKVHSNTGLPQETRKGLMRPHTTIGEGNGTSLQYSCLGKSHGRRSLVGYSPWGL